MKFIKTYENWIKHTSDLAMSHPLREFSRKLEDVVKELKKLDNFDVKRSMVRRYFRDDGNINILYKFSDYYILVFNMWTESENAYLTIMSYNNKYTNNSKLFIDHVKYKLKEYQTVEYESDKQIIYNDYDKYDLIVFGFPLSEQDDILEELRDSVDVIKMTRDFNL